MTERKLDPADDMLYLEECDDAELERLERDGRVSLARHGDDARAIVFTCTGCEVARRCTFAFDDYNTNGDCLLGK